MKIGTAHWVLKTEYKVNGLSMIPVTYLVCSSCSCRTDRKMLYCSVCGSEMEQDEDTETILKNKEVSNHSNYYDSMI